jgi:peptidoglycan/xylan/chitin deacetylase (PgdA/CDA1 family)
MFRKHLEWLDKKGFGLIGIDDYISGNYKEYERKPVLLTFDDSTAGQFRYKGRAIDPDCAVGILKDYSSRHPGFGHKAAFFIDFVDKQGNFQVPFGEKGKEKQKLEHMLELGMEIGNHTLLHTDMKKGKDTRNSVQFCDYLIDLIAPSGKRYFAYPYGSMPEHRVTDFDAVFAAWGGVAPDIESKGFDKYAIPRIEINNDFRNLEAYVK